jgi:hypothetical protein
MVLAVTLHYGCTRYVVDRYPVSRPAPASLDVLPTRRAAVGPIAPVDSDQPGPMCRMSGHIVAPDGERFLELIRDAFIKELAAVERVSQDSTTVITGEVDQITLTTVMPMGRWTIGLTLRSSKGPALTVVQPYTFSVGSIGEDPCVLAAAAFVPALRELMRTILTHPQFDELFMPAE